MEEKKNKRGRPKKESVMETIAVRLPFEIILEIDNYVNQIKQNFPGMNVTRADAIRQLINKGLDIKVSKETAPDLEEEKRRFWD
tara:strand:+ start:1369 stop:1620 length:252 start_codon:yes stop_codon:yes gene_type:complete